MSAASGSALGGSDARAVWFDAKGEFHLYGVRAGVCRLTLRMGGDVTVSPLIELGERA